MEVKGRKKPYLASFWTPDLANILFWFFALVFGVAAGSAFYIGSWGMGFFFLGAILGTRVAVECVVILFQIHDVLTDIRQQGDSTMQKELLERATRHQAARQAALLAQQTAPGEHRLG